MRATRRFFGRYVRLTGVGTLFALSLWGCKEECKSSADCGAMQQCIGGACNSVSNDDETDLQGGQLNLPGKDSFSESATEDTDDAVPESDRPTDSGERGEDTQFGGAGDGSSCVESADCVSGHCDNEVCCPSGDCCSSPGSADECPPVVCKAVYCDGNFQCRYFNLPVGAPDNSTGSSCDGDRRCDGAGSCRATALCASEAYKGTGVYTFTGNALEEGCRTSCIGDSHCKSAYSCSDGACIEKVIRSSTCESDADCAVGRCDETINACCESGHCCLSDAQCGRYACDEETRECNTTCRIDDEDVDTACSTQGNYHCDSGWCYDDLADGTRWCDEDGDCLSAHCDITSAMCCARGSCCDDDDDCDGTRCQIEDGSYCPDTCAPEGVADDALCRTGYRCENGNCRSGASANGALCESNDVCASGHCANGYCCDAGECCATATDCKQDSLCNVPSCQANAQCVYYSLPCGFHDIEGQEQCTGDHRCDGFGNCVSVSDCEGGYTGETFVCDEGTVALDCSRACEADSDCLEAYHCEDGDCVEDLLSGEKGCDSNRDCKNGHCNIETGVCCESGFCCTEDAECSAFLTLCDPESHSCRVDCETADDCSSMGAYYCLLGVCEPLLENGDKFCFDNGACVSGHCDSSTGICCESGSCCASDSECGGFACDETHSCVQDCTGDDNLCMDGWFCNLNICEPKRPNGALCTSGMDCASSHCDSSSGVCCDGDGECCLDASDCNVDNLCQRGFCSASFSCVYEDRSNGETCDDGLFCNGREQCLNGECTAAPPPCVGGTVCLDRICDETEDKCVDIPVNEGEDCTEPLFCIGNVPMKCTAMGICADPHTGTPPCGADTGNTCTTFSCNETSDACNELPIPDGISCSDNPCDGETVCESGECLLVGDLPCDDDDPCTSDLCTVEDNAAVCGDHVQKEEGALCEYDTCLGDTAACHVGQCVPSKERPCIDHNLCTEETCDSNGGEFECDTLPRNLITLYCDERRTIQSYELTREIYTYNDNCSGSYDGMETAVLVVNSVGNVTFVVADAISNTDVHIFHLTNVCDVATCTVSGVNSLAVQAAGEEQAFVLETEGLLPPSSVEVSVTCE